MDVPGYNNSVCGREIVYRSKDECLSATKLGLNMHGIAGFSPGDDVIPAAYRWPVELSPKVDYQDYETSVPVVDMAELYPNEARRGLDDVAEVAKKRIMAEMLKAAETWGVFQIVNHGVAAELMERLQAQAHKFFSLPMELKNEISVNKVSTASVLLGYGFKVRGGSLTHCTWSEGLYLAGGDVSFLKDSANKLYSKDCDKEAFISTVLEYEAAVNRCSLQVLHLLAEGLGIDPAHFERYLNKDVTIQRWNYYPPCPEPDRTLGLLEHTDAGLLAAVHLGDVGGLQVQRDGKWFAVRPEKNGFAIIVGDMLEMMTRGRFHSVPHRAVVNKSKPRLSIGNFLFLNQTMEVVSPTDLPVPAAEEPDTRPEYRPFTFAEFLAHKLSTQPLRTFEFFKVQHKSPVPTS